MGENLALDAANAGARAAAVLPLSADRGRLAAQEFLKQDANGTLTDTSVTVELSGQNVVVSVNRAHPDSTLHGVTAVLMDGWWWWWWSTADERVRAKTRLFTTRPTTRPNRRPVRQCCRAVPWRGCRRRRTCLLY